LRSAKEFYNFEGDIIYSPQSLLRWFALWRKCSQARISSNSRSGGRWHIAGLLLFCSPAARFQWTSLCPSAQFTSMALIRSAFLGQNSFCSCLCRRTHSLYTWQCGLPIKPARPAATLFAIQKRYARCAQFYNKDPLLDAVPPWTKCKIELTAGNGPEPTLWEWFALFQLSGLKTFEFLPLKKRFFVNVHFWVCWKQVYKLSSSLSNKFFNLHNNYFYTLYFNICKSWLYSFLNSKQIGNWNHLLIISCCDKQLRLHFQPLSLSFFTNVYILIR